MATGTMKWFAQGLLDLGNKIHNLSSDVLKLGIVTTATVPSLSTAAPHWGGTGTTNFATNQVGTGGTQYTGPKTLASVTWTNVSNVPTLRATDIAMSIDASGVGVGAAPTGKVDTAATLPTAPTLAMALLGGFTAAALFGTSPALIDVEGSIILPPGAYAGIYALTAVTGLFSLQWEEVPV